MENIKSIIESLLFIWGEPLSFKEIAKVVERPNKEVKSILNEMKDDYLRNDRGLELKSYDDNYQLVTKKENFDYISKLINKKKQNRLSNSAMEVLSIIAYKQPVTRLEIEEIRGVKSSSSIDLLVRRELIEEVGRLDKMGKPILYGTTLEFLRVFSLENLDSLPNIKEIELFLKEEELNEDQ